MGKTDRYLHAIDGGLDAAYLWASLDKFLRDAHITSLPADLSSPASIVLNSLALCASAAIGGWLYSQHNGNSTHYQLFRDTFSGLKNGNHVMVFCTRLNGLGIFSPTHWGIGVAFGALLCLTMYYYRKMDNQRANLADHQKKALYGIVAFNSILDGIYLASCVVGTLWLLHVGLIGSVALNPGSLVPIIVLTTLWTIATLICNMADEYNKNHPKKRCAVVPVGVIKGARALVSSIKNIRNIFAIFGAWAISSNFSGGEHCLPMLVISLILGAIYGGIKAIQQYNKKVASTTTYSPV